VVLGAAVADAHLAELAAAAVSYLVMPDDDIDLGAMLVNLVSVSASSGSCWKVARR
jgi:hypothetical protein